jgi:large subunit ribosomal protein L9
MEVILREDYLTLGYTGDRVKVKGGYARNYLLPRNIAVEASRRNQRILNHELSAIMARRIKRKAEAEEFAKTLAQVIVEFSLKIGRQGRSFGSITTRDIETKLASLGYKIDKRQIRIPEPIKAAGAHEVEVRLHSEVTVPLNIKVIAEREAVVESAQFESADGEKPRRGKGRSGKKKGSDGEAGSGSASGQSVETAPTDA